MTPGGVLTVEKRVGKRSPESDRRLFDLSMLIWSVSLKTSGQWLVGDANTNSIRFNSKILY